MRKKGGVSIVLLSVAQKDKRKGNGLDVTTAVKKFIELLETLRNPKIKDFFVQYLAIVLGKIRISAAELMLLIG